MRLIGRHRLWALAVVIGLLGGLSWWYFSDNESDYHSTDAQLPVNGVVLDTTFYAQDSGKAPVILLAHGFGGSKNSVADSAKELAGRGYNVLTWTARGFGRSSGEIHLNARDYEIKDAQALIDWAARQKSVALDAAGDPKLGVVGGSYGGALALNLAGVDKRVDAIVPQITYNDLARSLLPDGSGGPPENGVLKKGWVGVLFGSGSGFSLGGPVRATGDPQCGRFAADVCAAFLDTVTTGRATPDTVNLLRSVSPNAVAGQITAPTLLIQGMADSLFPLPEAEANAKAITSAPVRLAWFSGGHDGGAGSNSDQDRVKFLTVQWLDHYLLHKGDVPGSSFTYSRVTGVSAQERGLTTTGFKLDTYPGLDASPRSVDLTGREQRIASPPNGVPSAISVLPGLALGGTGLTSVEMPGQNAAFESAPLTQAVDVVGTPSVQLRVASPTGEAVLFAKLYDVSPNGQASLPNGLVAPVRLSGLPADVSAAQPVKVTLPAISTRVDVGHRVRLVIATSDQSYQGPVQPVVYTVAVGNAVSLPTALGTPLTSAETPLLIALAVLVGLILLGILAAILVARARHRGRDRAVVAEYADTPLVIKGLRKEYAGGYVAVRDISLTVQRGQVVGLLGPNGAGKTTSLRVLMGLTRPSAGEVLVFGHQLIPGAPVLSRLGALVEGPGFLPHLSGMENLRLYWQSTGRPAEDSRLDEVLEIANLGKSIHRKARTYSHGMKQRLAIAQAMLGMPELLVLDEPTDGLDPPQIAEMRRVLKKYAVDGRAVLVSSHLLAEVEQTCTHVVVVNAGRLVASGPVAEVASSGRRLEDAFLALVEGGPEDDRD
ncbi:alpha/beta fold hydrolase [Longispora fulva]|uniref:ABC-2 type transport system ATP-binding protein n=1 Tax=Longispora fulva TaxID=619741 RepID=A0A8J7GLI5_9ACTN|nr:alpha/beta fold hydrolase [Longispora fulva]MBG6139147.1 ABC-2 type transport system ATP-binding protein [Longispora fulva]